MAHVTGGLARHVNIQSGLTAPTPRWVGRELENQKGPPLSEMTRLGRHRKGGSMDRTKFINTWTGLAAAALMTGTMVSCSVTQNAAVEPSTLSASGFLGPDYAR